MLIWKPPKTAVAFFRIEPFEHLVGNQFDVAEREKRDRLVAEFLGPLGMKSSRYESLTLPLSDARWPALLDALDEARRAALVHMSVCFIEERWPKPSDKHAWFDLGVFEFDSPRRTPKGRHFGWREGPHLASQAFFDCVQTHGLTGLSWLPLEDSRRDDPITWYEVFAEQPIGRGLDHPLIDPRKVEADSAKYKRKFDPTRQFGIEIAYLEQWRGDAIIDCSVIPRLITLTSARNLFRVHGPKRMVREHLPQTDFAYRGWGWDRDKGPGGAGRPIRSICCNARTRTILIESGLMKPAWFKPIATVPAAEAVSEVLDRTVPGPIPPPIYTPAEAAVERTRREAVIAVREEEQGRLQFSSTDEAVGELERRIAHGQLPWPPAREFKEFDEIRAAPLWDKAPVAWQRAAPMLPLAARWESEVEEFDFFLVPPEVNDWLLDGDHGNDPGDVPSTDDLILARSEFGDWYAVRMDDPLLPADAAVRLWDHETLSIQSEWPSVGAFIAELLTLGDISETID